MPTAGLTFWPNAYPVVLTTGKLQAQTSHIIDETTVRPIVKMEFALSDTLPIKHPTPHCEQLANQSFRDPSSQDRWPSRAVSKVSSLDPSSSLLFDGDFIELSFKRLGLPRDSSLFRLPPFPPHLYESLTLG